MKYLNIRRRQDRRGHITARNRTAPTLRGLVAGCLLVGAAGAEEPRMTNAERHRAWEGRYDRQQISRSDGVQTHREAAFLRGPENMPDGYAAFTVAAEPPRVDFGIFQGYDPFYIPDAVAPENEPGNWADWGPVARDAAGVFYVTLGNHRAYGADAVVLAYDPATRRQSFLFGLNALCEWGPTGLGDGKFHGYPDMSPTGEMWLLSFFGPDPADKRWADDYRGGFLVRYDRQTGQVENHGIPLVGDTWPYHVFDWERNRLFAVGQYGTILVYDTAARKVLYGGHPPHGLRWFNRVTMLDRETGILYGTEMRRAQHPGYRSQPSEEPHAFLRYIPQNNRFERMEAHTPLNPVTGRSGPVRAHTRQKDAAGAFWCLDYYGTLFRFFPEEDRASEALGFHWGVAGAYTTSLVLCPSNQYLYYVPAAQGAAAYGLPVVQYNIATGERKVLAFLSAFFRSHYGYAASGTYGLEIDAAGESLFFYVNGSFAPVEQPEGRERIAFRRPAFFHVHIPASER